MTTHKIEILITGRDKASGPISGVKGALGGIGVVAGGILAAGVFQKIAQGFMDMAAGAATFVKDSVMSAARVEEMTAVLKTLEANQGLALGTTDRMVDSIKDLGITTQSAQWVTAQFTRWQLNSADATKLARLAQDAAVISMQDSSDALKGLMHGITTMNTRVLRTYGITLASTVSAQDEYAKSLEKTRAQLSETEKIQAVLNAVLDQGTQIQGAYEAAMDTAGKKARSMKRHVVELMNSVGAPFLNAFGNVVDVLTNFLKAAGKSAEEGGALGDLFKNLTGIFEEISGMLGVDGLGIESIAEGFEMAIRPISDFLGDIRTLLQLVRIFGPDSASVKLALEEMFGPEIAGFIQNVVDLFGQIGGVLDNFKIWWDEHGPTIKEQVGKIFGTMSDLLGDLAERIIPFIVEKLEEFSAWMDEHGPDIEEAITSIANFFEEVLAPAITRAWDDVIKPALDGILSLVGDIASFILNVVAGDWEEAWDDIGSIVDGILGENGLIRNLWAGLRDWVLGFLGTDWEEVKAQWQSNWDTLVEIVEAIKQRIIDKVSTWVQVGKDLVQGLWDGAKGVADRLKKWFSGIITGLIDKTKELLEFGSPSKLFAQFGEWIMEGLGEGIKSAGNVPQLAMAGVAPGLMGAAAGGMGGGGSGGPTYVNIEVNGARDPRAVVDEIMRRLRRQGVTLGQ